MHIIFPHISILRQGDKARVIQTFLFMSGVNTLLQTFLGMRLPTVMNPSFAFVIPVMTIINDYSSRPYADQHEVSKFQVEQLMYIALIFLVILL